MVAAMTPVGSNVENTMKTKPIPLTIRDCSVMGYTDALDLQMDLCQKRQVDKIDNTVLIVEHPAVITLGARKSENKLLTDEDVIREQGVEIVRVGRGGGTTAHNPGQLVMYPIIKLKSLGLDVNAYIRSLEQIGIELLQSLGVESTRRKGFPGLWIGEKKIASVGVQLKKWVSFHGMAININNDLSIFEHIVPCGLDGVVITSLEKEMGKPADMDAVKDKLKELCLQTFVSPFRGL
ncbi:MAG: lipoyl(octanoyl) transferase [Planctomycetota bacterium]|nr:MAG: lipoyl(octanoyl) transferase [Planctomycetota bacterium]